MQSPTIQVNLDVLADNIHAVQKALNGGTDLIFVVKSDAYGHGAGPVVQRAVKEGVKWFAVAFLYEAIEVRKAAPDAGILILGPVMPDDAPLLVEHQLTPVVVSAEHAVGLDKALQGLDARISCHLKIDTGMGRLGMMQEVVSRELEQIQSLSCLTITGIMSHLATVDLKRPWLQEKQHRLFKSAVDYVESELGRRLMRHFCSSRGFQYYADWDYDAIRPGILLYGYGSGDPRMRVKTKPVLQWHGSIMQVKSVPDATPVGYYGSYRTTRDTRIAVIGGGYADGYLRAMSNRGEVLIGGKRYPVVGRISMNWLTVDVGPDASTRAGDQVTFLGEQGANAIWADTLGRRANTIAYEILTAIDPRIPREYISSLD